MYSAVATRSAIRRPAPLSGNRFTVVLDVILGTVIGQRFDQPPLVVRGDAGERDVLVALLPGDRPGAGALDMRGDDARDRGYRADRERAGEHQFRQLSRRL